MSGKELKNCPFCGAELIIGKQRIASCKTEGCAVQHRGVDLDYPKHIAAWNRRTPDPAQIRADAIREALDRVKEISSLASVLVQLVTALAEECEADLDDVVMSVRIMPEGREVAEVSAADIIAKVRSLLATPLSPTAVDGSAAPDAGGKEGV